MAFAQAKNRKALAAIEKSCGAPVTSLAIITPSYIGSHKRADFARRSLQSLRQAVQGRYPLFVVDDIPHFKVPLLNRLPDIRYSNLARHIYQGDNIQLLRQHGHSSSTALLLATREARRTGYELVFIHLDDNVYIPLVSDLLADAADAFDRVEDLQFVRLTGYPILSLWCTPEMGNRTQLTIEHDRICFENVVLQPQRFEDYTLWWSPLHEQMIDGLYHAIPMWFTVYRAAFLEKLLTLNNTVASLSSLGQVELYYKDAANWRSALEQLQGKFGYINMQFGGLEMERNANWETLIHLPNTPLR